jgi:hypothetical protein
VLLLYVMVFEVMGVFIVLAVTQVLH